MLFRSECCARHLHRSKTAGYDVALKFAFFEGKLGVDPHFSCEQDMKRLKLVKISKDKKFFLSPMNCILRGEQ